MSTNTIHQIFGSAIDPFETLNNNYCIRSIAWSLSMQCRFNGQVRNFYSVAEHSYILSHLVPRKYALAALMHDAAEAYIGDVVVPIKRKLADFKTYEQNLEASIMSFFNVDTCQEAMAIVDNFDKRIVYNEWALLCMSPMPKSVSSLEPIENVNICCFTQRTAYRAFLDRFEILTNTEV